MGWSTLVDWSVEMDFDRWYRKVSPLVQKMRSFTTKDNSRYDMYRL